MRAWSAKSARRHSRGSPTRAPARRSRRRRSHEAIAREAPPRGAVAGLAGAIRRWPYRARMARTRLYKDGQLDCENFPVSEVSDHIAEPNAFVWLDYCEPSAEDLATIAQELQLHPLAVEDAVSEHQRPKLDRYDSHLFVNAYSLALDTASGELETSEIGMFITRNALVTVRKDKGVDIEGIVTRWDESKELAKHGVSFLLWGVLDYIVDGHFEAVQSLDTEIEAPEGLLFLRMPR